MNWCASKSIIWWMDVHWSMNGNESVDEWKCIGWWIEVCWLVNRIALVGEWRCIDGWIEMHGWDFIVIHNSELHCAQVLSHPNDRISINFHELILIANADCCIVNFLNGKIQIYMSSGSLFRTVLGNGLDASVTEMLLTNPLSSSTCCCMAATRPSVRPFVR